MYRQTLAYIKDISKQENLSSKLDNNDIAQTKWSDIT